MLSSIILAILLFFFHQEIDLWIIFIFAAILFLFTFLMNFWYFKRYVYRSINELFKGLNTVGNSSIEYKDINFSENVIENVNKRVKVWIDENKKAIDKYKVLSDYRTQFLGDISHELKTPLFSVQGYLHTLLDGALFDEKNNVQFLQKAIKNADRLESIVSDLDMISKYEAGEMKIVPVSFNVQNLFSEVFDDLEYSASQKEITLSFKTDSKSQLKALADAKQIRHVCTNLISNAIHYGKVGGFVKVGIYKRDHSILVEVSDNGIGIPEKHLSHLFDRFYRIDASRSRNKGGSGLGLSIVKHILNGHKQSIHVESMPGKGSTFTFTLDIGK
jgi:two-component system phosphate regulon sensor histidine kinase PhoR